MNHLSTETTRFSTNPCWSNVCYVRTIRQSSVLLIAGFMVKRLLILLLVLGALFGSIFGWKHYKAEQNRAAVASMKPPAVTVASTVVSSESWQSSVPAVGTLSAIQGVEVSSEVAGIIDSIGFDSGVAINQGALLVQLDATTELADLRALEAQLKLARLDYDRATGLALRTALSQAQLDRAKSQLDSLAAQADAQRATINRKTIRAPFGGVLGIRRVDVGEYLAPGAPIVSLQRIDVLYVDFNVPERYLQQLQAGQTVTISTAAYPDREFTGSISAISPRVDDKTRNVQVRATVPNEETLLRPGMFAKVTVLSGGKESVLTLPRTAISFYPYGDSVFVILGDGEGMTAERRHITTGRVREGKVEVLSGVLSGDKVVNAGQLKLRSGQPVAIDNSVKLPEGVVRG